MNEKICTCLCHWDNKSIMHCIPCCEHTYEKYINEDGTIDMERYNNIKNK